MAQPYDAATLAAMDQTDSAYMDRLRQMIDQLGADIEIDGATPSLSEMGLMICEVFGEARNAYEMENVVINTSFSLAAAIKKLQEMGWPGDDTISK